MKLQNLFYSLFIIILGIACGSPTNSDEQIEKEYEKYNSLNEKNNSLHQESKKTINAIGVIIENNPKLKSLASIKIKSVQNTIQDFSNQIDFYKNGLLVAATHKKEFSKKQIQEEIKLIDDKKDIYFNKETGNPNASKEKKWTTWWMIEQGNGDDLDILIQKTNHKLLMNYEELLIISQKELEMPSEDMKKHIDAVKNKIPLKMNMDWAEKSNKSSWAAYEFEKKYLPACMVSLEKIKSDALHSKAMIMNNFLEILNNTKK